MLDTEAVKKIMEECIFELQGSVSFGDWGESNIEFVFDYYIPSRKMCIMVGNGDNGWERVKWYGYNAFIERKNLLARMVKWCDSMGLGFATI